MPSPEHCWPFSCPVLPYQIDSAHLPQSRFKRRARLVRNCKDGSAFSVKPFEDFTLLDVVLRMRQEYIFLLLFVSH